MINENAIDLGISNKNISYSNNNILNNIEKLVYKKIYDKYNNFLYEEYKLERNNFNPHKLTSPNVWEKRLVNRITDHSEFYNFNLNK
tara:strand:+ start:352 stop:612 length:261 start_codon:yes stop_codon:yes gene_type:complete